MKRAPRPLSTIIASDATLSAWQDRRAREERLARIVRAELPRQLAERVEVREAGNGTVDLVTTAGAVAAAVRQRGPHVLAALVRQGLDVRDVRVRVQVATTVAPTPRSPARRLDRKAAAPLGALAQSLPEGPLRAALARLLRRTGS